LAFFLGALPVLALNPDKSLLQYNCRSWTRQNGLPANGVKAIAQTRDGYLWLGTAQGLVRFDGVEFKLAEMPKSPSFWTANVTCLASSQNGGLWFGLYRNAFGFYNDDASRPGTARYGSQRNAWRRDSQGRPTLCQFLARPTAKPTAM
jgi:hypothetical protein